MSYRLEPGSGVVDDLRRIAREQIDKAIADTERDDPHEAVHEVRKRCKKLRALLRLVRPAFESGYRDENRRFRDAARTFSALRDATSRIETCDGLLDRFGDDVDPAPVETVRGALVDRRDGLARSEDIGSRLRLAREAMERARERASSWTLGEEGFDAVAGGFGKTVRRARRARTAAYASPSVESFHEWRKRVKYHRYHVRLLREVWRPIEDPWRDRLHALTDLLGDDHDLAVLVHLLETAHGLASRSERAVVSSLALQRSAELRALARPLGDRLFAESRSRIVDRHRAWWRAAEVERSTVERTVDARAGSTA